MSTLLVANNGQRYSRTSVFGAAGNAFTMSAWVYLTALPGVGQYRNAFGMNGSIGAGVRNSGGDSLWFIGTNANDFDSSTGLVAISTWYHLVLTRNGNTKTLYVDGVQRASGSDTEAGNTGLVIGDFTTTGDNTSNWDGRLAWVKVWDGAALTADEVKAEWLQGAPVRFTNLKAFYPFFSIADDEVDYYVNAQTLTVTQNSGSITTADGAPVPFKRSRNRYSRYVSSASGATANVTGVAGTGAAGTVSAIGAASVTLAGVAGAGQIGTITVSGVDVTKQITGVSATGAAGTVAAVAGAVAALTGVSATGSAGTVTEQHSSTIVLTGVSAVGQASAIAPPVHATIEIEGVACSTAVGTLTATGAAKATLTGVSATGLVGAISVSAAGNVNVSLTGVQASGAVGALGASGAANVALSGVSGAAAIGALLATGSALQALTGVGATGTVGTLTAVMPGSTPVPRRTIRLRSRSRIIHL